NELLTSLDALLSQNFLTETEEIENGYRFLSNVVQEVVYEEISSVRKRVMHRKAAEVLERMHGKDEDFWSVLAYHYKIGENRNKFLEFAMKAGRNAARKFANAEAIFFLKEAFVTLGETAEELPHKIEVSWELAEVLELEGRYDEAMEILDARITYTKQEKMPEEVGKCYRKKAEIYIYKGDYDKAFIEIENATQCLRCLEETHLELARVWSWRGIIYERKGDYHTAIECQQKALHVFEKTNATKDFAGALNRIGVFLWYMGEHRKALEIYKKCLEIQEKLGDLKSICTVYNNMGLVYGDMGDCELALEHHKKSLALKEKIGDVWGIAASYNNIGLIYDDMGEYDKALEFYEKSLGIYKKIGDVWGAAVAYGNIGVIHFNKGDYEKALECYEKSLEIYQRLEDMLGVAEIYINLGSIFENRGEYEKALKYFQEGIALAVQIKNKELISEGFLHMSAIYIAKSDMKLAKEYLKEGKRIATEIGIRQLIAYAKVVEGKLLVAKGKLEMGIKMLKDALEIYDEIKSRGVEYYTVLFEIGRIEQNKEILENVLEFFERTGNKVWMAKVKRELLP
ncbi:MAG: tetratricopeptide repeat protein, partial [Thermoplasmata archaeon]